MILLGSHHSSFHHYCYFPWLQTHMQSRWRYEWHALGILHHAYSKGMYKNVYVGFPSNSKTVATCNKDFHGFAGFSENYLPMKIFTQHIDEM